MQRRKILLVEDSPLPQKMVKIILEQLNCCVDVATTGEDAVILCAKNNYRLILMDIGLPGIDGIMAARLIREQERKKKQLPIPIIALTAHDDEVLKAEALATGMNDYLIKPISLQLAQKILNIYCHKIK
jgi:CheY-like chemotaxis protein